MPEITLPYTPREQFIPFHQRNQRWAALVCHRRAGKTVACVNDAVTRAVYTQKKNARYGYIGPYYRQVKEIAWMYLKEATDEVRRGKPKESLLSVELFNGAKVQLFGADNPDALRGLYFDGVILDEYADMRPSLWGEVILPTLADRRGWAVFIGTPKGRNQFWQLWEKAKKDPTWFNFMLRASESGLLAPEELEIMRGEMTEEQYLQEFECSFDAAVVGSYYSKLLNKLEADGRLNAKEAEYDPEFPVSMATDLGFSDSTSIWYFQERPDGWALIDYDEEHGKSLDFYFDLWRSKPYQYEMIWLPHDARAKTLQTGRSTAQQIEEEGFPVTIQPRLSKMDGINAARLVMKNCWFAPGTAYGVECLRQYHRKYDEVKKIYLDEPAHDWSSHGADAFRGFALVARHAKLQAPEEKPSPIVKPPEYRLQELFDEREQGEIINFARARI